MITREDIVKEAKEWIGTPWHHCSSSKGKGCDCVGLVVGVVNALGMECYKTENYTRVPQGNSLIEEIEKRFARIEPSEIMPGDVLVFKLTHNGPPCHVAYKSENSHMIHASLRVNKVVECEIGYWSNRLVAAYRVVVSNR